MPKNAIDYSKTIIYKICCKDESVKDVYVGHTTNFQKRKYNHKMCSHKKCDKVKLYKTINDNGGWDNWDMVEVAVYNCNDATEARIKEQYHKKELNATLNTIEVLRTEEQKKEYYSKGSEWYAKNHERAKLRYINMCQKIDDLEKENAELKAQLEDIIKVIKKN